MHYSNKQITKKSLMPEPILYSFRRCPFAIRARWALACVNQNVIIREVCLKNKPIALKEISPKGTVPVLVTKEGEVIEESLDIMKWAVKNTSNLQILRSVKISDLTTSNELIIQNDSEFKYHLDRFKYASRYKGVKKELHQEQAYRILLKLNNQLKSNYLRYRQLCLVSNSISLADWAIWPFIRQYRIANKVIFDEDKRIVFLRRWLNYFLTHKYYDIIMKKHSVWHIGSVPERLI